MLFSSIEFIYLFLPAALLFYFLPIGKKGGSNRLYKNIILFLFSIVFYAYGEPVCVFLLLLSIIINYVGGLLIGALPTQTAGKIEPRTEASILNGSGSQMYGRVRRIVFVLLIVINLAILFVFKYLDFAIGNINAITGAHLPLRNISLPIGISFYTFQLMSYDIDVYRGRISAQKSIISLGLYTAMFPQLIAGPIVRYSDIAEEIENRRENWSDFKEGLFRFVKGLSKKVLIANNVALLADKVFALASAGSVTGNEGGGNPAVLTLWIGAVAYTIQIYFDFSGYSDMAIGLGRMFGFHIHENFNKPYMAASVTEFWRRWHISLTSWFRDYVYIPLGGNRKGTKRQVLNLFIVWLLVGLWHGANWTFVVWGVIWFAAQIIEKQLHTRVFGHIYTMLFICITMIVFRSENLSQAGTFIRGLFGIGSSGLSGTETMGLFQNYGVYLVLGIFFCLPIEEIIDWVAVGKRHKKIRDLKELISPVVSLILLFICTSFILSGSYDPFIYFNF